MIPTFHPAAILRGGGERLEAVRAVPRGLPADRSDAGGSSGSHHRPTDRGPQRRVSRRPERSSWSCSDARSSSGPGPPTRPERSARRSPSCSGRATPWSSPASSEPARPRSCKGSRAGSGVTDQVASPTFTLVREYHGRLDVAHVDVYRLERIQDVMDLGLEELGDGEAVLLVEWGDAVEEVLPGRPRHDRAAPARSETRRGGSVLSTGRTDLGRPVGAPGEAVLAPWSVDAVIVLGIETSTPQTSVAIGSERRDPGERLDRGHGPAGVGHARAASSCCAWSGLELERVGGVAVGHRSGAVHRAARRASRRPRPSPRCWACRSSGITSLDALAFAVRHTSPTDRRRDRRAPGRGVRRRLSSRARRGGPGDRLPGR